MLSAATLFPGLTPLQLGTQCGFKKMMTYRVLDTLLEKKYLFAQNDYHSHARKIFPLSLPELSKRIDRKSSDLMRIANEIQDINVCLRYPKSLSTSPFDIYRYYGDEARESFYDLLHLDWNHCFGCGDLDSYLSIMGIDFERNWVKSRVRKSRTAHAYYSSQGPITDEFAGQDDHDLRTSKYISLSLEEKWFTLLPEIQTMTIFLSEIKDSHPEWSLLKIESKDIVESYLALFQSH